MSLLIMPETLQINREALLKLTDGVLNGLSAFLIKTISENLGEDEETVLFMDFEKESDPEKRAAHVIPRQIVEAFAPMLGRIKNSADPVEELNIIKQEALNETMEHAGEDAMIGLMDKFLFTYIEGASATQEEYDNTEKGFAGFIEGVLAAHNIGGNAAKAVLAGASISEIGFIQRKTAEFTKVFQAYVDKTIEDNHLSSTIAPEKARGRYLN